MKVVLYKIQLALLPYSYGRVGPGFTEGTPPNFSVDWIGNHGYSETKGKRKKPEHRFEKREKLTFVKQSLIFLSSFF